MCVKHFGMSPDREGEYIVLNRRLVPDTLSKVVGAIGWDMSGDYCTERRTSYFMRSSYSSRYKLLCNEGNFTSKVIFVRERLFFCNNQSLLIAYAIIFSPQWIQTKTPSAAERVSEVKRGSREGGVENMHWKEKEHKMRVPAILGNYTECKKNLLYVYTWISPAETKQSKEICTVNKFPRWIY